LTRHTIAAGIAAVVVILLGQAVHAWSWRTPPGVLSEPASLGTIVRSIEAEGTLKARETIRVGSQASGTITELDADSNSIVHRGEVLARLDPSLVRTEIQEARATLAQAKADDDQARVARDDAKYRLEQARVLRAKEEIPQGDFETVEASFEQAEADVRAMEAQVALARSQVAQAEVDLRNTVILSPVDGVVIAREVQVGQTVASRMEAPTLFEIATDLARMQVIASVDEADIGAVAVGQRAHFTVGAYPDEQFSGTVGQVRLSPDTSGGDVEYDVVIDADNAALKLRPGMTPTVSIEVARRERTLRVPDAALRFVPSREVFDQLRDRIPGNLDAVARAEKRIVEGGRGFVWMVDAGHLKSVPVTVGISDGIHTEVLSAALQPGTPVVTGVTLKR
jgi:HlyD family secretion protein